MKNKYHFPVFLLVLLVLVALVNFVVYEGVALSFLVSDTTALIFGGISVAFGFLFFIAALLCRTHNNFISRWLYRISAVWLGFLIYFFAVSFVYILYVAWRGPSASLSAALFALTALVTVYGALHARDTKIKNYRITIPNLPESWRGRRAAFISDVHLGQVYRRSFSEHICKKIEALNPDIVFIVGDLFDGVEVDENDVILPFSKLSSKLGTYFVMGNHEEFGSNGKYLAAVRAAGFKVLLDEMTIVDGLQLMGVDYQTTNSAATFQHVMDSFSIDSSRPSILLKHVPTHMDIAEKKGISLQLGGHTHKGQTFPVTILVRIMFKKFYYGYQKFKNMQVLTSSGVGTTGAPIRVETNSEIVLITFDTDEK